jgi:hypothetical protein
MLKHLSKLMFWYLCFYRLGGPVTPTEVALVGSGQAFLGRSGRVGRVEWLGRVEWPMIRSTYAPLSSLHPLERRTVVKNKKRTQKHGHLHNRLNFLLGWAWLQEK